MRSWKPSAARRRLNCGGRLRRGGGVVAAWRRRGGGVAAAHLDDALHESGRAEKKRADHHQYFPRLIQG